MFECHKYEREHGDTGKEVGVTSSKELDNDPEYKALRKRFYMFHGFNSMANLVSFVCSGVHLWFMAK